MGVEGGATTTRLCSCGCELKTTLRVPFATAPVMQARVLALYHTFASAYGMYADAFKEVVVPSNHRHRCHSLLWVCDLCWADGFVYIVRGPGSGRANSVTTLTAHCRVHHSFLLNGGSKDQGGGASGPADTSASVGTGRGSGGTSKTHGSSNRAK